MRNRPAFSFREGFWPAQQTSPPFLLEPVTLAFDVQRSGMMQQTVQYGRGQDVVVEDLAPVQKALVAGDNCAGLFVATHNQAEEEAGLFSGQRQIADLVDDKQFGIDQLLERLFQAVFVLSLDQASHQRFQGQEVDRVTRFHSLDAQGHCQMGLAHARRPQDDHILQCVR